MMWNQDYSEFQSSFVHSHTILPIYLVETLRRIAMDDIHWVIGHGKVNKECEGMELLVNPRAYTNSKTHKHNLTMLIEDVFQ